MKCYFASSGLNYKNGWGTVCPRQSNILHTVDIPSIMFNSRNFKLLRAKLENDEWPSGCHLCKESEEIGHPSMRHDWEWVDENLRHVELRFSNACNMHCLHCSEVFSSQWEKALSNYDVPKVAKQLKLSQLTGEMHRHSPQDDSKMNMPIPLMEEIVQDLNKNFPYLEMVDFAGGEVLFQKQFFPCLELLAEHPNRNRLKISFHTNWNAPFDARELHKRLQPFREVTITISLDSSKKMYPYFRKGNWDTMRSNLENFVSLGNPCTRTFIQPTCTTSVYQMMDFYNLWKDFLELEPFVTGYDASIVQTPHYLDPSVMLHDWRPEIEGLIEQTQDLVRHHESASKWVNYISDYVLNKSRPYNDYNRLLHYIAESDKLFNQNFNDAYDIFGYDHETRELYLRDC